MANEITVTAALSVDKNNVSPEVARALRQFNMSGSRILHYTQSIGTSEEALAIGEIGTVGWAFIRNNDSTNFVELRVATGGAKFAKLLAGEFALFRFGSGAQVPYAIADTGACLCEFLILEA